MGITIENYANQVVAARRPVKSLYGISGQCVSIPSDFYEKNGLPSLRGSTADVIARTFRDPAYDVVRFGPGVQARPGDTVFFSPNVAAIGTGYAGHVCLFLSGDIHSLWTGLDQDWDTGSGSLLPERAPHGPQGVSFIFRAKSLSGDLSMTQEQLSQILNAISEIAKQNATANGVTQQMLVQSNEQVKTLIAGLKASN